MAKAKIKKPKYSLQYMFDTKDEFETATKAGSLHSLVWALSEELRKMRKYGDEKDSRDAEYWERRLHELMNDYDVEGLF